MEAKTSKKIALWMDQSHAILVGYEQKEAHILEDLPSPIESHTREDGEGSDLTRFGANPGDASNNEHTKHNVHSNQIKAYFLQLEKKLMDKDELLLLGPGVTKTQFSNYLKESKHHKEMHITVENADKMSPNQLLALVKEKFSGTSKTHSAAGGEKSQHPQGTHLEAAHQKEEGVWAEKKEDHLISPAHPSHQKDREVSGDKPQHKEGITAGPTNQKGEATWSDKNQTKPGSTLAGAPPKIPNPSEGFSQQKQGVTTGASHEKDQPAWGDKNQPKQGLAHADTHAKDQHTSQDKSQQKQGATPAGTSSKDQVWNEKSEDKKGTTNSGIPQNPPRTAPRLTSDQEEE